MLLYPSNKGSLQVEMNSAAHSCPMIGVARKSLLLLMGCKGDLLSIAYNSSYTGTDGNQAI